MEKIVEVPAGPVGAPVPVDVEKSGSSNKNSDQEEELRRLREELASTQTELSDINEKCLQISSSMLPHYLAQQWILSGYVCNF